MCIFSYTKKLIIKLLVHLLRKLGYNFSSTEGIKIMYIVKADNPEVGFNLSFTVTDSEGNTVPDTDLVVEVQSDNEDAVAVIVDETGKAGTVSFGNPGFANVNATVESSEGVLLGSFGAQFTVTVGDPAAIAGGKLVFEGLSESEEV